MSRRDSAHGYMRYSPIFRHLVGAPTKFDTSRTAQYKGAKASWLTQLPNELLLHIAGYLRVGLPPMVKEERFDGKERITYVRHSQDLVNLAKVCRKLRPIAQECLLHTIVLGGFDGLIAIVSLVRVLLNRPEMGKHVRRLRIGLPPNEELYFRNDKHTGDKIWHSRSFGSPSPDIGPKAIRVIYGSPLTMTVKNAWRDELCSNYARPLCGILLALMPVLEHLSISHSLGHGPIDRLLREMFGVSKEGMEADFSTLPALADLRYFNGQELRPHWSERPMTYSRSTSQD